MADADAELAYTEQAPMTLGDDNGSKPKLYEAAGYYGPIRLGTVGYYTGSGVQDMVDSGVLIPVSKDATGVPPLQAAHTQRIDSPVAELGYENRSGGGAIDTNALVGGKAAAYEPGGPTSLVADDPDAPAKRPVGRPRARPRAEQADTKVSADRPGKADD
jgi:hypothetical protein